MLPGHQPNFWSIMKGNGAFFFLSGRLADTLVLAGGREISDFLPAGTEPKLVETLTFFANDQRRDRDRAAVGGALASTAAVATAVRRGCRFIMNMAGRVTRRVPGIIRLIV